MKCAKCGRQLTRPAPTGYGPKCATAVLGARPARSRHTSRRPAGKDERQTEMFGEVRP